MPLGTLDRTPPPFFRQGPSALTKLALFSALAVFLMAADTRLKITQPMRSLIAAAITPLQRALRVPVEMIQGGGLYLQGLSAAINAENTARAQLAQQAERSARVDSLTEENRRLRALLDLRPGIAVRSQAAEVMYEAADIFSRKLYIDRGATQDIKLGAPVITEGGVVGQVTRVYPLSSEVTLLVDRDAAIPVLNTRTQQRGAAFGGAEGQMMELRFMAGNADVQVGDVLVTSGVDGVYPPGLAVATVVKVERRLESGFAFILLKPSAHTDGVRHALVLEPIGVQLPPPPEAKAEPPKPARAKGGARK
jgi:rod shape-determining protein MreC